MSGRTSLNHLRLPQNNLMDHAWYQVRCRAWVTTKQINPQFPSDHLDPRSPHYQLNKYCQAKVKSRKSQEKVKQKERRLDFAYCIVTTPHHHHHHPELFRHFQRSYHQVLYLFGNLSWPPTWIPTQMQIIYKFFCNPFLQTLYILTSRRPTTKCYTFLETSHDPRLGSQLRCK